MKTFILIVLLSILPSGLIAQKKDSPEVIQRQIQYIELAKKAYLSKLSQYDASFDYINSLEKLLIPLCERYEIISNQLEKYDKQSSLKPEPLKKDYLEYELADIKKAIIETNRKIREANRQIGQLSPPAPPDIEVIGRQARLQAVSDLRQEREQAREERRERAKPSERYFVGVFIAKEITPARKTKKTRRK